MYGLESLCYVTDFLVRSMVVQVQRSAEDSSVVEATYEGEHNHLRPMGAVSRAAQRVRRLGVVLHLHQLLRPNHYAGPHQEPGRRAGCRGRGGATGPE